MPETTPVAKPTTDDSVIVRGPDQRTYKFPKGTDKAAAIAYFKRKGISGPRQTTPQATQPSSDPTANYGYTAKNVGKNIYEGAKGTVKGTYEIGKDLLSNPNWFQTMPQGQRPSTMQRFVTDPAKAEAAKAQELYKQHRLLEAAGHASAAALPIVGPWGASLGEQAGKGDIGGAMGQLIGGLGTAKIATKTVDKVTGFVKPEALRQRAAELNTKVFKQADAGSRDYKTSVGLQVAQEQIVSNARELPARIEQARATKNAQVRASAQAADQAGVVINVSQDIRPIVQEVAQVSNARGQWTPTLRNQVGGLLKRITTQTDFKTGQMISRDLSKFSVSQALALEKGLEDLSAFGKEPPAAINNLARRLRGALNDKLPSGIQKLRAEESRLITARDAARENYAKILNDKTSVGRGIIYGSGGTIAAYLALKGLGVGFMGAVGSVVVMRALAQSTRSRTFRAALYAKAASLLDGSIHSSTSASAPLQGTSPISGPTGPRGPQPVANRALAGQSTPPFASANVVQQNAPAAAPARGTMLPASATRARAGSGDYVKGMQPKTSVATRTAALAAPAAQSKAMFDRLDTLYERQAKPKSGADRNAIEREITEIKGILQGENLGTKHAGAPKRIADRERLAGQRAEASATAQAPSASASGEMVSQGASPETRAIALDAGYKALSKYEGGDQMVKEMRATAKAMQKLDPSFDEVEKLTEVLEVLKQVSGGLDTGEQ